MTSSDLHRTSDFQEAIYLRKCGIIYVSTEWLTAKQAVFVFKKPSEEILSAWQRGDDGGVRAVLNAADFFRDELRNSR